LEEAGVKKVPTLFERDWDGDRSRVLPIVTAGCAWVLEGEGVATRKYDGTCMMFDGNGWYARREVKPGKTPPEIFVEVERDEQTGKVVGWVPAPESPFVSFFLEALDADQRWEILPDWEPGTYELVGPKIQGNPEGYKTHQLIRHAGAERIENRDRSFEGIRLLLNGLDVEGIVYQHPDGRMAKIKKRDFGLRR
jgi:hypothetical protein